MSTLSIVVNVATEIDVAEAAREARRWAIHQGFSSMQVHYLATAASELAANLLIHAGGGQFELLIPEDQSSIEMRASDQGPGITDIGQAMQEGYSTAGGLGCGLPGVQRLMDELEIDSQVGVGTVVRARKWR
jgi:serine/threonine-protein kinase RsbT